MNFIKLLIGLLFVSAIFYACTYDQVLPKEIEVGNVSFSGDIMPIFNASCNITTCHNGTVAPDLRPANAFNQLSNGGYINLSNPENSELYLWMRGERRLDMPLTGPNPTYNAKILAWIQQGANND